MPSKGLRARWWGNNHKTETYFLKAKQIMKNRNRLLGTLLASASLVMAAALPATAALDAPINVFAVGATNGNTTLASVIITARSGNNGTPRVQYLSLASDKATSKVQAYKVTAQTQATFTNSTVTLPVTGTNQGVNWNSGTVIIRHMIDDSYEKRSLTSNTGSTNIVLTAAPLGTVIPGDIIYYAVTTGAPSVNWGASTNTINAGAGGILVGQQGKPLLIELDATSSLGNIYTASGDFVPPVSVPRLGSSTGQ